MHYNCVYRTSGAAGSICKRPCDPLKIILLSGESDFLQRNRLQKEMEIPVSANRFWVRVSSLTKIIVRPYVEELSIGARGKLGCPVAIILG